MPDSKTQTLEQLRALIRKVEGQPRVQQGQLPTRIDPLDAALGGWPSPGLSELSGRAGSGRVRLLLPAIRATTRAGGTVGVVDPLGLLHPPGLQGVELQNLLVLQPSPERAGWAAEQLAAAGALEMVVLLAALRLGRSGPRLARAAEQGSCAVIVVTERKEQALPASLRVQVEGQGPGGLELRILKQRGRMAGQRLQVRLGSG
jgi:RecA/RadA recombinase